MGISLIPGSFLARNAKHVAGLKRGLVLGRQKLHLRLPGIRRLALLVQEYGIDVSPEELTQEDGFTEALLSAFGYPNMEAMDFTTAEGAAHIHD